MSITVNHSVTADLPYSSATLADLKELVAAAEAAGLTGGARITVDKYDGNQREPGYVKITVRQR